MKKGSRESDGFSRRRFLHKAGCLGLGISATALFGPAILDMLARQALADINIDPKFDNRFGKHTTGRKLPYEHVADHWTKLDNNMVQCGLCPNNCILTDGERCRSNAKEPKGGVLYDMLYGHVAALHVDPIEKLPLYHIRPGMRTLCFATAGCGLHCTYCQNWQLSQSAPEDTRNFKLMPKDIVSLAKSEGLNAICGAYTEPLTFFEFMRDTAIEAKKSGLGVYIATGGYINPEPASEIAPLLDGIAFGLKGFSDKFYDDVIGRGVELDHILTSLDALARGCKHIEIVNLILPGLNDKKEDISALAGWVYNNLGAETPLHFLRFFPEHKLKNLPMTPPQALIKARETALEQGLKYVYIGNLPGHEGNCTYCPKCGKLVVQRVGLRVIDFMLTSEGKCKTCGAKLPGDFTSHEIHRFG